MSDELNLSNLKPAQAREARKRVGRGPGSGKGRYSGRGIKGQKSRAGSHTMRPGFEGGQMPIYMRHPKQRGNTSKDALPIGPFRTTTVGVNIRDLDRVFDHGDEITIETLVEKGLVKNTKTDVKILGMGETQKRFAVTAHLFSASAREKLEKAGGTATALREPVEKKKRKKTSKPSAGAQEPEPETSGEPAEPAADADPVEEQPETPDTSDESGEGEE